MIASSLGPPRLAPVLYGGQPHACARHSYTVKTSGPRTIVSSPSIIQWNRLVAKRRVPVVLCRAEAGQPLTVQDVISALAKASSAWGKYDKDRNGTMSLKECETIFNSDEIGQAFEMLTNVSRRHYTAADLEPFFKRADRDNSGTLSRSEFLALYLAVVSERVKRNPLLLAEALLGFLDKDKNGVLEGREIKSMLLIMGFAPALLLPIPGFMKIEYRSILNRLGGMLEDGRKK